MQNKTFNTPRQIQYMNTQDMNLASLSEDGSATLQNFSRYLIHKSGIIVDLLEKKILKSRGKVYQMVTLHGDDGISYQAYVHHIICRCFLGIVPDGGSINHLNENPKDNRAENLQICETHQENCNYGSRNLKISANCAGKTKPKHSYQVITEYGDYFFYESRADMMRAFPSQKPSTWHYRKGLKKDYFTAEEDGVIIYIKDMGILTDEEKQQIRKEIARRA